MTMEAILQLLPLTIIGIGWAIGMYFLAPRIGANRWLWVILSFIPFVNFFFFIYASFKIVFAVLDKLEAIQASVTRNSLNT